MRLHAFIPYRKLYGSKLVRQIVNSGLSLYGISELNTEFQAAFKIAVESNSLALGNCSREEISVKADVTDIASYELNGSSQKPLRSTVLKIYGSQMECSMKCSCFYPSRMGLPCRHIIQLCLEMDKNGEVHPGKDDNQSWISFICTSSWSPRWKLPTFHSLNEENESSSEDDNDLCRTKTDNPELDVELQQIGENESENCEQFSDFPSTFCNGGGRQAYAMLFSEFKNICEQVTSSNRNAPFSSTLYRFLRKCSRTFLNKNMENSHLKVADIAMMFDELKHDFEENISEEHDDMPNDASEPTDEDGSSLTGRKTPTKKILRNG